MCVKPPDVQLYTNEINMPYLWNKCLYYYSQFMPSAKYEKADNGAFIEFDTGVVRESLQTLSSISCPTCP